ncbi:MAG: serine hydrolase [Propionibacteriaceae bacterium]
MDEIVSRFSGEVGYVVANLGTGERLTRNATTEFPTASTIKLPLLTAFHDHAHRTGLDWSERVRVERDEAVAGSGILGHLDSGVALTHRDLVWLMICLSDNLATNVITDAIGGLEPSAALIHEIAGPDIHLRGRAGGAALAADAPRSALSSATPEAFGRYLDHLTEGHLPGATETISVAEQQVFHSALPRYLSRSPQAPVPLKIAHKTGALPGVRTDVGIVTSPTTTLTIAMMTSDSTDLSYDTIHEGDQCIGALTHAVCREWLGV